MRSSSSVRVVGTRENGGVRKTQTYQKKKELIDFYLFIPCISPGWVKLWLSSTLEARGKIFSCVSLRFPALLRVLAQQCRYWGYSHPILRSLPILHYTLIWFAVSELRTEKRSVVVSYPHSCSSFPILILLPLRKLRRYECRKCR